MRNLQFLSFFRFFGFLAIFEFFAKNKLTNIFEKNPEKTCPCERKSRW